MARSAESEARKALNRLRRSVEKAGRELDSLEGSLVHAEGEDFPVGEYERIRESMQVLLDFCDEEGRRLQQKILHSGGLEPGRVRRTGR